MSKAKEFLDFWVENSVHPAEQYARRAGTIELRDLVERCVEMAESQGFTERDLENEVGNLPSFIRDLLAKANHTEDARTDRHQNEGYDGIA